MEFERGPPARTEGYSISGSHAKSVVLNCGGTLIGGNRFSVSGPVRAGYRAAARQARDAMNKSGIACKSEAIRFSKSLHARCCITE